MTTTEEPPEDFEVFKSQSKNQSKGAVGQILENIIRMPKTMIRLGVVQFFSWFAFFSMWSLANPGLTEHVYKAPVPIEENFDFMDVNSSKAFQIQNEAFPSIKLRWGKYGCHGLSSMVFAFLTPIPKGQPVFAQGFTCFGGSRFLFMYFIPNPELLWLWFVFVGVAWGSILSMPYAMLSNVIDPNKMGIMMGLFNMFIVIPQIFAAIGGVNFLSGLIGDASIFAIVVAGISLIISGISNFLITDKNVISYYAK